MSDSLCPHRLQHARPPCPSPTPGVYSNSCPSRWWCHPTISSSVVPFSSCLQSFPASGSFQLSQFFASGGQSIGVWASTSVLPMNNQDWSTRMDWLDLLAVQGTLKSLLQHHSFPQTVLSRPGILPKHQSCKSGTCEAVLYMPMYGLISSFSLCKSSCFKESNSPCLHHIFISEINLKKCRIPLEWNFYY